MTKALVYDGSGHIDWTDVALPELQDVRDAIVRVDAVTLWGTDLHILKGDVPEVQRGSILGHEAVGTVLEVASAKPVARWQRSTAMSDVSNRGGTSGADHQRSAGSILLEIEECVGHL